jgi:iron complex transport system ATP-binding protein
MKEAILRINNLSCGYDGNIILRDIGLVAYKGEIISIIGPNGSGKTTLLRAVSNILKPEKGEIRIQEENLTKIPRKELAGKIAVVAQAVEQAFVTVEEYVLLGRLPYFRKYQFFETKKDMALARKYMELTDTFKLKDSPMSEISGGERQLASIARALVQEPILLLLDEPTSHLDITHQVQILELIKRLNRELGLTVLMVLHDLNLASEYSDRLVLFNGSGGSIYREGIPEEVITRVSIEDVYQTEVLIKKNPLSGKPYVILVSSSQAKGV